MPRDHCREPRGSPWGNNRRETARRPETSQEELAPTAGHGAQDSRAVLRREERRRCPAQAEERRTESPPRSRPVQALCALRGVRHRPVPRVHRRGCSGRGRKERHKTSHAPARRARSASAGRRRRSPTGEGCQAARLAPGLRLCPREQRRPAPREEGAPGRGGVPVPAPGAGLQRGWRPAPEPAQSGRGGAPEAPGCRWAHTGLARCPELGTSVRCGRCHEPSDSQRGVRRAQLARGPQRGRAQGSRVRPGAQTPLQGSHGGVWGRRSGAHARAAAPLGNRR